MSSFIIHGPYKSGKTTILWPLKEVLNKETDVTCVSFDMLGIKDMTVNAMLFLRFLIHCRPLTKLELTMRLRKQSQRHFLVDEIHYVFTSDSLLSKKKDFYEIFRLT